MTDTLETTEIPIGDLQPSWDNPRHLTDQALDRIVESIRRYGYTQPILVDPSLTIITGHSRYAALLKLGWKSVPVIVIDLAEDRVREYRVIDNRTAEFADWDDDLLAVELALWEQELVEEFFGKRRSLVPSSVTAEAVEQADRAVAALRSASNPASTEVSCPACGYAFEVVL